MITIFVIMPGKKSQPIMKRKVVGSQKKKLLYVIPRFKKQLVKKKFPKKKRVNYGEQKSSLPATISTTYRTGFPNFNNSKKTIICHREYLQELVTRTDFNDALAPYLINPGLSDNFPWLSQIAMNYEFYKFRKLRFIFRNRIGTATPGSIYTATQHDAGDPVFSSKQELLEYEGAQSSVIYRDHTFDCLLGRGSMMKKLLVRTGELTEDQSIQLYDAGKFTVVTNSTDAAVNVGDLLVEYEVELTVPKLGSASAGLSFAWYVHTNSPSNILGGMTLYSTNAGISEQIVLVAGSIVFPTAGLFDITVTQYGNNPDLAGSVFTSPTGGVSILASAKAEQSSTFTVSIVHNIIYVPAAGGTLAVSVSGATGDEFDNFLYINQIPDSLLPDYLMSAYNTPLRPDVSYIRALVVKKQTHSLKRVLRRYEQSDEVKGIVAELHKLEVKEHKLPLPVAIERKRTASKERKRAEETRRMVSLGKAYQQNLGANLQKLEQAIDQASLESDDESNPA
jgi:hypothetical protein